MGVRRCYFGVDQGVGRLIIKSILALVQDRGPQDRTVNVGGCGLLARFFAPSKRKRIACAAAVQTS